MLDKSQLDENLVEKMTENFLFPLSDIMTNYFKLSTVCISVGQHPHTFNVQCGQNLYKVTFFVSQVFHQYGHSGGARGWLGLERCQLCLQDIPRRQSAIGEQQWVTGFHCVCEVL